MLRIRYAFFKQRINQSERVRIERKYGDVETIPPLLFLYELLRSGACRIGMPLLFIWNNQGRPGLNLYRRTRSHIS